MIHQYDHRWATYESEKSHELEFLRDKKNLEFEPTPNYWVPLDEVEKRLARMNWKRGWVIGWRKITNATNEQT